MVQTNSHAKQKREEIEKKKLLIRKQKEAGEKKRWLRLVLILLERKEEEEEDNLELLIEAMKLQRQKLADGKVSAKQKIYDLNARIKALQREKNGTRNDMGLDVDENIILEERLRRLCKRKERWRSKSKLCVKNFT